MRRAALAFSLVLLAASPAMAQDTNTRVFGKATCGAPFPCAQLSGQESTGPFMSQLIGQANRCVTENFGNISAEGFFIPELGLDYKRCLSPRYVRKSNDGPSLTANCCVTDAPGGGDMCILNCQMKLES